MREQFKVKYVYYLIVFFLIVVSGVTYYLKQQSEKETMIIEASVTIDDEDGAEIEVVTSQETANSKIFVHVCGEVITPGVYELEAESRLFEAVDAAGGLTADGVESSLNLARVLSDGEQIYVPSEADIEKGYHGVSDPMSISGLISINTANVEQLMTLSGIGESKAKAIIDYRNKHGNYIAIEDIMNVSGIKQTVFDKIKDQITL